MGKNHASQYANFGSLQNESTVQGVSVFVSPCAVPFRNVLCAVLFILLVEFHYGFYSFSENIK